MDGNTSTSPTIDPITAIIGSLPGATLIADRHGRVLNFNRAAARLLPLNDTGASLFRWVRNADALREGLRSARRSDGHVPVALILKDNGHNLRATIRPVKTRLGRPAAFLLIVLETRQDANYRLLALNQQLGLAIREQKLLRQENRTLRDTVQTTLPLLKEQTVRDPLTGAFNRRFFDRQMRREWNRTVRLGGSISLIYGDIDHFKDYNDALGHPRGDQCLRDVAGVLRSTIAREFDRVCRIGGEEFAIILPMTNAAGAMRVAQRAVDGIQGLGIPHPNNVVDVVTASFGVGTCQATTLDRLPEFITAVDRAMYTAKRRGRNRIVQIRFGKVEADNVVPLRPPESSAAAGHNEPGQ